MYEHRLFLAPGAPQHRFSTPQWRSRALFTPAALLLEQAKGVDPATCQRFVFTGNAALLHPEFEQIVEGCAALGLKHFVLETDAAPLAQPGLVERLGKLGFEQLSVVVGGVREKVHDAVMQDPGAFKSAIEGLTAALRSSAKLYVEFPLLRANAADAEPLLEALLQMGGKLHGFMFVLPDLDQVTPATRAKLLLRADEQAEVVSKVFRLAQGNRVEYGLSTKRGISPCAAGGKLDRFATVFHDRFNFFKSGRGGDVTRVDACKSCSLTNSCNGVENAYLETFGEAGLASVPLEVSMNWKLRRLNLLEKFDYQNVSPFKNDAPVDQRGLLRINGHCNMSCAFCFVDRTAPDFDADQLAQEIDAMAKAGIAHLVLSGGEPTLHPALPELIARSKRLGFKTVEVQTNGVYLADKAYAQKLVDAGLTKATLSLHSTDPEHSDEITRLPGAFPKTIKGMQHLRELGVLTQVAHVITKANYKELPKTVRFLRETFPESSGHLSICFAIAQGISDLVFHWVIPTFEEIRPYFKEALDYCLDTGVGFGGMIGQGGFPPCMLDGDMRYYENVLDKVFRSTDADKQFFKPAKCRDCEFDAWCLGPRKAYVDHYGEGEIKPFALTPAVKQKLVQLDASRAKVAIEGVVRIPTPTDTMPDGPPAPREAVEGRPVAAPPAAGPRPSP